MAASSDSGPHSITSSGTQLSENGSESYRTDPGCILDERKRLLQNLRPTIVKYLVQNFEWDR